MDLNLYSGVLQFMYILQAAGQRFSIKSEGGSFGVDIFHRPV